MSDTPETLRAQAYAARELIATLDASTHNTKLYTGHREPFQWGHATARQLVDRLVTLAREGEAEAEAGEPQE